MSNCGLYRAIVPIVGDHLMAGLQESLGHVSAHAAQSDHAELHSWSPVDLQISVRESTNANTLTGTSQG